MRIYHIDAECSTHQSVLHITSRLMYLTHLTVLGTSFTVNRYGETYPPGSHRKGGLLSSFSFLFCPTFPLPCVPKLHRAKLQLSHSLVNGANVDVWTHTSPTSSTSILFTQ